MTSNAPLYPLICLRAEAVTAYILLHYSELEFFTNTGNPKCLRRQFHTQLLPVHIPSLPSVPFMLPEHVTCARKPPEPPNTPCFLPSVTGQELLPLPGMSPHISPIKTAPQSLQDTCFGGKESSHAFLHILQTFLSVACALSLLQACA